MDPVLSLCFIFPWLGTKYPGCAPPAPRLVLLLTPVVVVVVVVVAPRAPRGCRRGATMLGSVQGFQTFGSRKSPKRNLYTVPAIKFRETVVLMTYDRFFYIRQSTHTYTHAASDVLAPPLSLSQNIVTTHTLTAPPQHHHSRAAPSFSTTLAVA